MSLPDIELRVADLRDDSEEACGAFIARPTPTRLHHLLRVVIDYKDAYDALARAKRVKKAN
jgi:hypothetical protein